MIFCLKAPELESSTGIQTNRLLEIIGRIIRFLCRFDATNLEQNRFIERRRIRIPQSMCLIFWGTMKECNISNPDHPDALFSNPVHPTCL